MRPDLQKLMTVRDSRGQNRVSRFVNGNVIHVKDLEIHDNNDDDLAVIASAQGCADAGFFPVRIAADTPAQVDLLLPPKTATFNFFAATWDSLRAMRPQVYAFLKGDDEKDSGEKFMTLRDTSPQGVACLLNITTAMSLPPVHDEDNLLTRMRHVDLVVRTDMNQTEGLQQDRFFGWADKDILRILKDYPSIFELAPAGLHPGADLSYKEIRFGEANLQFTFHTQEKRAGTDWIKIEMDMDYYHDAGAHILLEVIPNELATRLFKPHLTDPEKIYALRWMAGKHAGETGSFDPLYTLQPA
jgi:hypothetical protein